MAIVDGQADGMNLETVIQSVAILNDFLADLFDGAILDIAPSLITIPDLREFQRRLG